MDVDRQGRAMRLALEEAGIDVQRTAKNTLNLNVSFPSGSASLTPQAQSALKSVASVLNQNPESTVNVTGHADDVGSDSGNQRLSKQRAGSVASYLVANGINAARISQQGMGERAPKFSSTDEASRAENRRAELAIVIRQDVGTQPSERPPADNSPTPRTYPPSGGE